MQFIKKQLSRLQEKISKNKKKTVQIIATILFLLLASFLIEYFGFGAKLHGLDSSNSGVQVVRDYSIENNAIVFENAGKYINNLELDFDQNPDYGVTIRYFDPRVGQDIALQSKLQRSMQKNEFNFLHFLVFKIDGNPQKISITSSDQQPPVVKVKIDNDYNFNFYRFIFIFLALFLLFIFFTFRKIVGKKPEYLFLAVVMTCGTLLSFSESHSFVSWDEGIHYRFANGHSFNNLFDGGNKDVYSKITSIPSSYSLKEQSAIDNNFDNLQLKENKKVRRFVIFGFSLVEFYNQLGHIPSGLALMLGRIVRLPNHLVFIFGRWINICLYSIIIFFAIRKLKTGKMIMAVIALFPTSIFLASNYSYDWWVTSFSMLGLAYLFTELQEPEKKISKNNLVIIVGSFVIGLGPKAIYFPLMLLLFLLKKEKFESIDKYKKYILVSVFSILFVIGSFMLPFFVGGPGKGDHRGGSGVNSAQQVKFILSNPLSYSEILLNFIKDYTNPKNSAGLMTSFAYLGSVKGYLLILFTLIFATITDKNQYDILTSKFKVKLITVIIFLFTTSLISTALYVAFTPVGNALILGVQPRYLIPLIFPILFVIGNGHFKNSFNKDIYNLVIFGVLSFVTLQGIWQVVIKTYY